MATNNNKRKAPQEPQGSETKRSQTISSTADADKKKPFRFSGLPAELRNIVYRMVAEEQTATLIKLEVTDGSGLLDVSSALHDEYLPILLLYTSKIETTVKDFDFRHIVTFLNRLSDAELKALPSNTTPSTRKIDVQLYITRSISKNEELLRRWLNRAGHPTKKGTMLNISYRPSEHHRLRSSRKSIFIIPHNYTWRELLRQYIVRTENARSAEEAQKIKTVLKDQF